MSGVHPAPLLSVTVLNYNYAHFLENCLDSILGQSFKDFELILVNDKSTDNSLDVIQPYLRDPRIRLVDHQTNRGFVRSLIEGVELSRGRYVSVISADDWAKSMSAFERQIAVMERDPEIAFAYSAYGHYEHERGVRDHLWRPARHDFVRDGLTLFRELALGPYVLHTGTVIRRTAYDAVGGYDASLKYAVDTKMWLALCFAGKGAYIDDELYGYRRHRTSMSKTASSIDTTIREVLRVIDWSFTQVPQAERARFESLHARARERALIAYAADEVFSGNYGEAWRGFRVAATVDPVATVFQRMTPILALRAAVGRMGFDRLRGMLARGNGQGGP